MLRTKIHLAISVISVIFGMSAFIIFLIFYANIAAAMWGLISALYAFLTLILHRHYLYGSLQECFSRRFLQNLGDFGMIGFICGLALTLFYIFLQIYYKTDILPVGTSIIIRMIWSFMMMKWGLMLNIFTNKYLRTYSDEQLFTEEPDVEET